MSVDDALKFVYSKLKSIINAHVPLKRHSQRYPSWYSAKLIRIIKDKERCLSKYKRHGFVADRTKFEQLRKKENMLISRCYNKYISQVESNLQVTIKEFWSYTKSLKKTNSYPRSLTFNDYSETNPKRLANTFAQYFSSVYDDNSTFTNVYTNSFLHPSLEAIEISEQKVTDILSKLDTNKGPGNDRIPNVFLFNCQNTISKPLMILFSISINSGKFPDNLKDTLVFPVFKKGNPCNVINYRPIAILNAIEKIFERIVYEGTLNFVNGQLSSKQHGFLKNKSTVTNLLEHVHYIASAIDQRKQVDVQYTDMSKAFDKVQHSVLLYKLSKFGIQGRLLSWFHTYLTDRPMKVVFNGASSDEFFPKSGVPQGSILGPLLFLIYVDELPTFLKSTASLYADDLKMKQIIVDDSSCAILQHDLRSTSDWCTVNNLHLNPNKCCTMSITLRTEPIFYSYMVNDENLDKVTSFRDLGVIFDSTLKFTQHFDHILAKPTRCWVF